MAQQQAAGSATLSADYVVYDCCRDATRAVLANLKYGGDASKVFFDQTFADDYGFSDDNMISFTQAVNVALNQLLQAHERKAVVLAVGDGQLVKSSATVGDFIGAIYLQAGAQQ